MTHHYAPNTKFILIFVISYTYSYVALQEHAASRPQAQTPRGGPGEPACLTARYEPGALGAQRLQAAAGMLNFLCVCVDSRVCICLSI